MNVLQMPALDDPFDAALTLRHDVRARWRADDRQGRIDARVAGGRPASAI